MGKEPEAMLGDLRREVDKMRRENEDMMKSVLGESAENKEGGAAPEPSDPLTEDHRAASSGRDLTNRINELIDDLEWRQIARDKQARAIDLQRDLEKPPAAVNAEWKANARRAAHKAPESARGAKQLLGRLLLKCETLIDDCLGDTRETSRFGLATQLVHAASSLARTMDRIGMDPRQTRHTVKVEREGGDR